MNQKPIYSIGWKTMNVERETFSYIFIYEYDLILNWMAVTSLNSSPCSIPPFMNLPKTSTNEEDQVLVPWKRNVSPFLSNI